MAVGENEVQNSKLTKLIFNNYIIQLQDKVKSVSGFVNAVLIRKAKALNEKKTNKEDEKQKNAHKANRLLEQVAAIKNYHHNDIAKFVVLSKKSLEEVLNNPLLSIDEMALTRVAANKVVQKDIKEFREKYPGWEKEIPNIIKSLGIKYRKQRLARQNAKGKAENFLEREKKFLMLLHDVVGLDVDVNLLSKMKKQVQKEKKFIAKKDKMGVDVQDGGQNGMDVKQAKEGKKVIETKNKSGVNVEGENQKEASKKLLKKNVKTEANNNKVNVKVTEKMEQLDENESEDENDDDDVSDISLNKSFIQHEISESESNSPVIITSFINNIDDDDDEEIKIEKKNKKRKANDLNVQKNSPKVQTPQKNKKKLLKVLSKIKSSESESTIEKSSENESTNKSKNFPSLSKESEIIKRQNKGTSKVKLLNLNELNEDEEVKLDGENDASSDEDEEFLKEEKMTTSKRKKTSFFLGRDEGDEESEDDDSEDEPSQNRKRKAYDEDEDIGEYDTNKFFKKKVFRGEDSRRGVRGGGYRGRDGENRGFRGRGERGGRGEDRGFRGGSRGGRGGFKEFDRRSGEDFTEDMTGDEVGSRSRRGFADRGNRSRGFGGRGRDGERFGGRGRGRGGFGGRGRDRDSSGGRGGFGGRGRDRESSGSRGGFGGRDRDSSGGRGGFGGRGRDRDSSGGRGRGGFSGRGRDSDGSGGRGRDRNGFEERGRGRGGFRGGGRGREDGRRSGRGGFVDSGSSNYTPLGERKSSNPNTSMLHPSWAAKKSQMSTVSFQGKKTVFND